MQYLHPLWLWLAVLVPVPWIVDRLRPRMAWPSFDTFSTSRRLGWNWFRALPPLFRGLAIGALAVALARPQTVGGVTRVAGQGVAIVVLLDHSSSMNTVDFASDGQTRVISRLEAARRTLTQFVKGRPDDLIGLVLFANFPDLVCPPTVDHAFLTESIAPIRSARPGDDGTNIGDAVAWGIDTLLVAPPAKKVLVLLTDGNNEPAVPNFLDPGESANLARELGITLHTIAIGQRGGVERGVDQRTGRPVVAEFAGPNLPLLESMARSAGGRSFVATDADALSDIFRTIDRLEKSPIQGQILTRYEEHFAPWAAASLGFLVLDRVLALGRLRRLP
jgi:Ca-activated chloride channel family protein